LLIEFVLYFQSTRKNCSIGKYNTVVWPCLLHICTPRDLFVGWRVNNDWRRF